MARQDYIAAKKLGDATVRFCMKQGITPYPPVLDAFEAIKDTAGEVRLGLLELPLSRIRGNKEMGRNNAFAADFMPILGVSSEFGLKWAALYDSYVNEGIRDAILVYESSMHLNDILWMYTRMIFRGETRTRYAAGCSAHFYAEHQMIKITPERKNHYEHYREQK